MGKRAKTELRGEMRRILSHLDHRWHAAASREICKRLSDLVEGLVKNGHEFEHILAWIPFFPGEVDLTEFITEQSETRRVYLPVIRGESMHFTAVLAGWNQNLLPGEQGIPEPTLNMNEQYRPENASQTLAIIPGMAFDKIGNRLGRGKGYYDRFLSRSRLLELTKVGVALSLQVSENIPVEPHDVPVDWIVTEEEAIKIG